MGRVVAFVALVALVVVSCAPAAAPAAAPSVASPSPTALGTLRPLASSSVAATAALGAPATSSGPASRPAAATSGAGASGAPGGSAPPAATSRCALPTSVAYSAGPGEYAGPIFDAHLHLFVDRHIYPTNSGSEGLCQFLDKGGFIAALGFYALPAASPPRSNLIVSQSALLIETARTRVIPTLEMGLDVTDLFSSTGTFAKGQFTDPVLQGYLAPGWVFQGIGEVPANVWEAPGIDSAPMQVVLRDVNAAHGVLMIHAYELPTDIATQRAKIETDVKTAPNITFLFHGGTRAFDFVEPLIQKYPNVFFSWDGGPGWMVGSWGSLMHPGATPQNPLGTGGTTDQFLADLQRVGIDTVVNENLSWLATRLQKYPDRIVASMDRNAPWHFDDASSDMIVKVFRRIVAKLPADLQARYAYQNAMRIFGSYLPQ